MFFSLQIEAKGLTDEALMEVVHFMRYLKMETMKTPIITDYSMTQSGKRILRKPGLYQGKIKISPDFDAPLNDFKEYM